MKRSLARGCIGAVVTLPAMMLGCGDSSAGSSAVVTPASTSSPSPSATAASLTSLAIDGLTMTPAFSPDIHDYAMRCSAGTNTIGVAATPADGATAVLVRPTATPLAAAQTANVDIVENDAVVVEARGSDGSASQYWVRCLPHDFPHVSMTRYGSTTPGYYLLGNTIISNTSAEAGYEMILDANGTPVWYYLAPAGYLAPVAKNVVAFPTVGGTFGTDPNGHYRIFHLDTGEETSVRTVGTAMDGHEFLPLPNGNTMLFAYPKSSGFDLSSRGVATTDIADCAIQEIAPDGSLVWSWLGSDHIDPVTESTDLVAATIGSTPVIDAFHCNSIERTPSGDLLVSARHLDAVFLVSRATGKILWKLGGVPQNKDGAQILELQDDPETAFYHQHDARLLANGNITLFDDHQTASGPARGMEIAFDTTAGTARVAWQYQGQSNSAAMGSFRRYDDGTSVVGWGLFRASGPALALSEVDANGQPLVEIRFDLGDFAYRATKAPLSTFDLDVLRRTAGGKDAPADAGTADAGSADATGQ